MALIVAAFLYQGSCRTGEVIAVERGRDYTLNVCGIGVVALRGVEPPLRVADGFPSPNFQRPNTEFSLPVSGEVLGQKDLGPQGVELLRQLVSGQRVSIVNDGWRDGDPPGQRYAYVFLADKTLVNVELIKRGFGYADRLGSHPRRDEFIALEEAARRQKVGVWAQ
jgi:hypothetical protein